MKTLVTAFACAALAAGSMIAAPAVFAQTASAQAVVTTTHTYHYGYAHRTYGYRHAAANKPCDGAYGSCGPYLVGRSAETGQPIDMDYQAPIGTPIYANGDVALICSCDHRH